MTEVFILQALSKRMLELNKTTLIEYLKSNDEWYEEYFKCDYYKENADRLEFLVSQREFIKEYKDKLEGKIENLSSGATQYLQDHHLYLKRQYIGFNDEGYGNNEGFWSMTYKIWCYLMEQLSFEQIFRFNFKFDFREFKEGIFE